MTCAIADCGKPVRARGWCVTHYWRWSKHGDPEKTVRPPKTVVCQAPDCTAPPVKGRYCQQHRARLTRLGTFDLLEKPDRVITSRGYIRVRATEGDPLADGKGWVWEHRAVLFAAIGPGPHACNWCAREVHWDKDYGATKAPDALVVDHIDEDKANNDPGNLVPSCGSCNLTRSNRWARQARREAKSA